LSLARLSENSAVPLTALAKARRGYRDPLCRWEWEGIKDGLPEDFKALNGEETKIASRCACRWSRVL
jgi:hypothetical protein